MEHDVGLLIVGSIFLVIIGVICGFILYYSILKYVLKYLGFVLGFIIDSLNFKREKRWIELLKIHIMLDSKLLIIHPKNHYYKKPFHLLVSGFPDNIAHRFKGIWSIKAKRLIEQQKNITELRRLMNLIITD